VQWQCYGVFGEHIHSEALANPMNGIDRYIEGDAKIQLHQIESVPLGNHLHMLRIQ
jgi:hypothetical protein